MGLKQEEAILAALRQHEGGLLEGDFREATRREVSNHTVGADLASLLEQGKVTFTEVPSGDGRIKTLVKRYQLAEAVTC